jgi:hypothetical protein
VSETDGAEIEQLLSEKAAAFERDRVKRWTEYEQDRNRRTRRVTLQFWFLFVVLFAAFGLLAYRTEVNANDLRTYITTACEGRQERIEAFNNGREIFIHLILNDPRNPVPPEQQELVANQLRQGLLLPTEDCHDVSGQ